MKKLKVKLTFTEPVLGTWPSNQNIAREFIASKSPDAATVEDEVAALGADAVADKGMTVFPRNEAGQPVLYDYQIKGFFKDSCGMLGRIGGKTETGKKKAVNESGKITAYKKVIDGLIFVSPRMIPICFSGEMSECQRPLRAQTAQGERVSLANSEQIPAGSTCEFEVLCMDDSHEKAVLEWLNMERCVALASGATLVRADSHTRFLTECNGIGPLWFASPRHSSELLITAWLWHCLETWREGIAWKSEAAAEHRHDLCCNGIAPNRGDMLCNGIA